VHELYSMNMLGFILTHILLIGIYPFVYYIRNYTRESNIRRKVMF